MNLPLTPTQNLQLRHCLHELRKRGHCKRHGDKEDLKPDCFLHLLKHTTHLQCGKEELVDEEPDPFLHPLESFEHAGVDFLPRHPLLLLSAQVAGNGSWRSRRLPVAVSRLPLNELLATILKDSSAILF